jgi:hypothetical protein
LTDVSRKDHDATTPDGNEESLQQLIDRLPGLVEHFYREWHPGDGWEAHTELATTRATVRTLDGINDGYDDMRNGRDLRGVITF